MNTGSSHLDAPVRGNQRISQGQNSGPPAGGLGLAAVLGITLAIRALQLEQPIVENYVGRQVPTAMVARNLERGSGFLNPSLSVAPFPNLFLVEPPIYASAVASLSATTAIPLDAAGRLVSAVGVTAGAWGLYGLVAARSGRAVGLAAALVFAVLPVTVRYGRAFQPDALMLGALLAGTACWDRGSATGRLRWRLAGPSLLSAGLAMKGTSAYVLIPLVVSVAPSRSSRQVITALATLAPAFAWYAYAAARLSAGGGSGASADNLAIWARAFDPSALASRETLGHLWRFLGWRSFTPLGLPLAAVGLAIAGANGSRRLLWVVWGASALAAMAAVAPKLHHEYYWLCLAPVVAAGAAEALVRLASKGPKGRTVAWVSAVAFAGLCLACSASTWTVPTEWRSLRAAGTAVRSVVKPGDWVAAPEALIYEADRRGCRVEFSAEAARRAAGEWPGRSGAGAVRSPADLVDFYRGVGARFFADVVPEATTPERLALHAAIRRRYKIIWDRDGAMIADLTEPRESPGPTP